MRCQRVTAAALIAGGDGMPVGAEGDGFDPRGIVLEVSNFLAGGWIPEYYDFVGAT